MMLLFWFVVLLGGLPLATCAWNFSEIDKNRKEDFSLTEVDLLEDISSETNGSKNFIFLSNALNIPCSKSPCERYRLVDLRSSLRNRGTILYKGENDSYPHLKEYKYKNAGSSQKDVFIFKISSFNKKEAVILKDIREYNAQSYILVLTSNEESFTALGQYILADEIFNIYIGKGIKLQGIYLFYEVCAFCNSGKTQIRLYNSWTETKLFRRAFVFDSSFKHRFYGAQIKVGLKIRVPHMFPIGLSENKSVVWGGPDYWLLKYLSKSLNFQFTIKEPKSKRLCYSNNGRPVGFCEMLDEKEVQLAGFPKAIDGLSYHHFDPTAIHYTTSTVLISANPATEDSVSLTFDSTTLTAVLVLYIATVFSMYLIECYSRNQRRRGLVNLLLDEFSILCFEGVQIRHMDLGSRIITGVWMVGCFFIISATFGEITSAAAVKKPLTNYINTMEDMLQRNISWIVPPTYELDGFLTKQLPEQARYKKVMDVTEGLKYVLENPSKYVYLFPEDAAIPRIRLYLWNGKGTNPFHFSPPLVGDVPWMFSVLQRKDSPYKDSLALASLRNEAAGLFRGKYFPDTMDIIASNSKLDKRYKEKDRSSGVSFIHTMMYFLGTCLFLLILSFISFISESLQMRRLFHRVLRKVRHGFQQINKRRKESRKLNKRENVKIPIVGKFSFTKRY